MTTELRIDRARFVAVHCSLFGFMSFASILGSSLFGTASAQEPAAKPPAYLTAKKIPPLDDENARKEKQAIKNLILKGGTAYNKQEVEGYYKGLLIPML